MMDAQFCVLSHQNPSTATQGLLCKGHARRILDALVDIGTWWAMLPGLREPEQGEGNCRGRAVDPVSPIRLEVLAVEDIRGGMANERDDIVGVRGVIHTWVRVVLEDLASMGAPRTMIPPKIECPATMTGDIGILRQHHEWICEQPWVDDYAGEIRACLRQMQSVLGLTGPAVVGHCPIEGQQGVCGGALHQDRWGGMGVSCQRCGAHWDDKTLRREAGIA